MGPMITVLSPSLEPIKATLVFGSLGITLLGLAMNVLHHTGLINNVKKLEA